MHSLQTTARQLQRFRFVTGSMHIALGMFTCSLGFVSVEARAQCQYDEHQKLTASDAVEGVFWGESVALGENKLFVGASSANCTTGLKCGEAYVFQYNGNAWVEENKLTASDAADGDYFGQSVALSGDTAVVGASGKECSNGSSCGAAYVFRFDGVSWVEEQKVTTLDGEGADLFGSSVSIDGERLVGGATFDPCGIMTPCGSAYVFRFDGSSWIQEQKLRGSVLQVDRSFGKSVSIKGDTIVVGSPGEDCAAGVRCGSAYVFHFDGSSWVEEQRLTATDPGQNALFGRSVWLGDSTMLVGSPGADCADGSRCGAAYLFRLIGTEWVKEQKLAASDATSDEDFGIAVTVNDSTAVVGASQDGCVAGYRCGSAYVFRFDGSSWVQEEKLVASDRQAIQEFGYSVAMANDTIVAGAPGNRCTTGSEGCGSAYVFSCGPPPTGACCSSAPGDAGACVDGIALADCSDLYHQWTIDTACADAPACYEVTGACCDGIDGSCRRTLMAACQEQSQVWMEGQNCGQVECAPDVGACCNTRRPDPLSPGGLCTDSVSWSECHGDNQTWFKGEFCSAIDCTAELQSIPTVSTWGITILTMTLLILAKIAFGLRGTCRE